jgi:hypothetical protein
MRLLKLEEGKENINGLEKYRVGKDTEGRKDRVVERREGRILK